MKKIMVAVSVLFGALAANAQNWAIDNSHSKIRFSVTHLVITETEGEFKKFSGKVTASKEDFSDAQIDFTIDVNSINTDDENRDKHLKGDDFFNAEKFPTISFKGKSLQKVNGSKYLLEGDLTIRDVTKHVTFDVVYNGIVKDPWGNTKAGFKVNGTINRFDYNLKWNSLADVGPVVSKEVNFTVNLELKKL